MEERPTLGTPRSLGSSVSGAGREEAPTRPASPESLGPGPTKLVGLPRGKVYESAGDA